jgi:hypothetical protein
VEHRAADAGVLVHARRPVRTSAAAELDLALVEVLLELPPLGIGRGLLLAAVALYYEANQLACELNIPNSEAIC